MLDEQQPSYVGPLEPLRFTIGYQDQSRYLEALQDYHDRYKRLASGPKSVPLVHPGILLSQSNATRSPSFDGPNIRWLHMREKTHFTAPAHVDDELTAQWSVMDHKAWFGRSLTCVSCVVSRRDEQEILRRTMWGLRASAQQLATAAGDEISESSPVPEPKSRPSFPQYADEISGKRKSVTGGRIVLFSGGIAENLHTDDETARKAGLAGAVASASQGMGYLCEFMIDYHGEEWLTGGEWALTFRRPIFAGDHVSPSGRLRAIDAAGHGAQRMHIRLVNQDGLTVTDGSATSGAVLNPTGCETRM